MHRDSDHPRHVKEGIAKGQARRLRRLCSEEEDYWKYAEKTKEKLMSRGYGEIQVKRQLKEGSRMSREEAMERAEKREDKRINFVTTHSTYLPNVNSRVVPNWVKFHILIYLSPLHKCPIKEGFLTSWGVKSNKKPCRQNYRVAMGIFLLP